MVYAIIIAGGSGTRTGKVIPKQFINVNDKPILLYTLDSFQAHSLVDAIEVVCLDGWQEVVKTYAKQYGIKKLQLITKGGSTVQESIRNGIFRLEGLLDEKDVIIIHDGIRPLVDQSVLTDVIQVCLSAGNAVSSLPYNEQIFVTTDQKTTNKYVKRETLRRVMTPQAYYFKDLLMAYREAFKREVGIYGSSYTNTMMVELGYTLHFSSGSEKNIKITTNDDIELFKAYLSMETMSKLK